MQSGSKCVPNTLNLAQSCTTDYTHILSSDCLRFVACKVRRFASRVVEVKQGSNWSSAPASIAAKANVHLAIRILCYVCMFVSCGVHN